jgi:alpha/beta superfamily hydrolase
MHGNGSSRREAKGVLSFLLPLNITVFLFDFSGCGHSQGKYISLGYYEKEDLSVVLQYLRNS